MNSRHSVCRTAILSVTFLANLIAPIGADVVLQWNQTASDILVTNTALQNPGMASRTMAMMNLAIYDGLTMTSPSGHMYYDYGDGHSTPGYSASGEAAAAQAAYTVLNSIYPDQNATLQSARMASLSGVADGVAKTEGIELGTMIGESIVQQRATDGYDSLSQYSPTDSVGHWQPDPVNPGQKAWGPAWGNVQPFALKSNTQAFPPPMPDLTSDEYSAAFNEVKELGAVNSTTRTAEQTEIGLFWAYDRVGMGTPMRMYNNVLQTIAEQQGNTVEENAALFAKATVAMADAGIVAWNSKFAFDFWRPVTGIRQAGDDGNPLTEADPEWTPLGAPSGTDTGFTPPFSTYLSGHATFGGALFTTLAEFYGTDDLAFVLESEELPGVERSFASFSEAMAENGRSRVYLGIHWNFDDTVGQETGGQIAHHIMAGPFIAAVPEPSGLLLLGTAAAAIGLRRRPQRARHTACHTNDCSSTV